MLAALVFFNVAVVIRTVGVDLGVLRPAGRAAAAALGAAPWTVWRTVTLPALRPAIVSAASVVFLFCATAFGVVLTLGGAAVRHGRDRDLPAHHPAARPAGRRRPVDPPAGRRRRAAERRGYLRRRSDLGARRAGQPARPSALGWGTAPALAATGLVLAFLAPPIVALVVRSLRRGEDWSRDNYRALATVSRDSALLVPVTEALVNSLRTAVDATVLAVVLGLVVSVVVSRRPRSAGGGGCAVALDGAFMLPLGVSAVTLGFGFLITLDQPPLDLRASPLLVPIAQALVALPLVVRTLAPVLARSTTASARPPPRLGAAPLRALLIVDLPVVWRPLLAAAGFAFAVSLGEFGATRFLARPERPTLPVVIYELIGRPGAMNYGMALAASVVLALLTGLVMGLVERLPPRRRGPSDVARRRPSRWTGVTVRFGPTRGGRRRLAWPCPTASARRARAVRLRQVDPAACRRRAGAAGRRRGDAGTAPTWRGCRPTGAASP